jgi:hypothetical protein
MLINLFIILYKMSGKVLIFIMDEIAWKNCENILDLFSEKLYCPMATTINCTNNIDFASYLLDKNTNDKYEYTVILRKDTITIVSPKYKEFNIDKFLQDNYIIYSLKN